MPKATRKLKKKGSVLGTTESVFKKGFFFNAEGQPILQTCQHLPIATLLFLAPTKLFVAPTLTLRCQPLCVKRKFPRSLLLEIWNFFPSIRRCQPWRQLFLKELKK